MVGILKVRDYNRGGVTGGAIVYINIHTSAIGADFNLVAAQGIIAVLQAIFAKL